MQYYLNFEDFEQFKNAFQKKIDEFDEEVLDLFKSCNEVEWVGKGHDSTINALYTQIDELITISNNLNRFLEFMNTATDYYEEGVEETRTRFKEVENMISIIRSKSGGR